MYCPAKERGMWFTRGRGTGPLQARGIGILKESRAPCDLAKTEQGSAVFASRVESDGAFVTVWRGLVVPCE